MADTTNTGATGQTPPNHLGTSVPSGNLDEKKEYGPGGNHEDVPPKKEAPAGEEEEEDEDIDALIEELESQDAGIDNDEDEVVQPGGARTVPEELLQTSTRTGLSAADVQTRRKKYGLNQMKEEKENLVLKFLGFFIGPIQFVMEVSQAVTNTLNSTRLFGRTDVLCIAFGLGLTTTQAAAVLAAGLKDWVDFGVICALLLLNAAVGFIQEFQAGSIVAELKKTLALKATVLRDGQLQEIEAPEVVPGDILQIEEVSSRYHPNHVALHTHVRAGYHHPSRRPHRYRRCLPPGRSVLHHRRVSRCR